jgi:hypothetical protein
MCYTTDSEDKTSSSNSSSSKKFKINLFPDDPFDDAQAKDSDGSTIRVCIYMHIYIYMLICISVKHMYPVTCSAKCT